MSNRGAKGRYDYDPAPGRTRGTPLDVEGQKVRPATRTIYNQLREFIKKGGSIGSDSTKCTGKVGNT